MIPEDDRGPAWLRDYGYIDFGDIAADIDAMEEYATKLDATVRNSYGPHMTRMSEAMMTPLPVPNDGFAELSTFFQAHWSVQDATQENVYGFGNGTIALATAAQKVGRRYRGTDAFAHATVADITKVLDTPSAAPTTAEGDL
jgi:hypothetical protein